MWNLAVHEAVASSGAAVSAGSCGACLASFGVDPTIAGPIAVIAGVLVRVAIDIAAKRRANRNNPEK